ncbi:MAG: glycosyltransferase family 2 protein [Chloroflexi bacterium]|nr:glycosyltransferase family 2 protein [Chloroflexota bacterium]
MTSQVEKPYLSVAISAYNEERRIGPSLQRIVSYLDRQGYPYEIVINDDGSRDNTAAVVTSFASPRIKLLVSPTNQGKGAGIRRAVLHSNGRYILFTDADLSTPIEEVAKLLAKMENGCDVVIGSRVQPDGTDMRASQPLYRRLLGRLFHFLAARLILPGIADSQSGFKCFRREVAHHLFAESLLQSIIFDVEILYLAQKSGYRISEVPVSWTNAGGSRMRLSPAHALRVLWDLIRIPRLHRR